MAAKEKCDKPVIVTTKHRGVFFGYVSQKQDCGVEIIRIENVRMVVSWTADVRGILGLAAVGPSNSCRVGLRAPAVTLRDVTAVVEVSEEAAEKFEVAPWSK